MNSEMIVIGIIVVVVIVFIIRLTGASTSGSEFKSWKNDFEHRMLMQDLEDERNERRELEKELKLKEKRNRVIAYLDSYPIEQDDWSKFLDEIYECKDWISLNQTERKIRQHFYSIMEKQVVQQYGRD